LTVACRGMTCHAIPAPLKRREQWRSQ
jgi:hypothetical protein